MFNLSGKIDIINLTPGDYALMISEFSDLNLYFNYRFKNYVLLKSK